MVLYLYEEDVKKSESLKWVEAQDEVEVGTSSTLDADADKTHKEAARIVALRQRLAVRAFRKKKPPK